MQLHIERDIPVPISEQIKGQISYAIMCGILRPGDVLPSVRDLSQKLGVSPMTVARVYRELASDDLIVAKPGAGTQVADIARINGRDRHQMAQKSLRQIADMYTRHALSLGHPIAEVRREFLSRLEAYEHNGGIRQIALVGNFEKATRLYAQDMENMFHDLGVRVIPLVLGDLERDFSRSLERLRSVTLVVTIPSRLQTVRALLEPHGYTVVAVAFRPRPETQRRIAAIPPGVRIGVVATYPEFLQSLLDEVASYCLSQQPFPCATLHQEKRIREMLPRVDVLVYASGSDEILDWLPPNVEAIEYQYWPDPDSVNRLRPLIAKMLPVTA